VAVFAKKFDGDPRIEFVVVSGHSHGTEPVLASKHNEALRDQWMKAGLDAVIDDKGHLDGGRVYLDKAIKPTVDIFCRHFKKTPVALQIHLTENGWKKELIDYGCEKKLLLLRNALNVRVGGKTRASYADLCGSHDIKFGWSEFGGSVPREADRGKKQEYADERIGRQSDTTGTKKKASGKEKKIEEDMSTKVKTLDLYKAGIGDDSDPDFKSLSRASYMPLAEWLPELETRQEYDAALKWAHEHLVK